MQASDHCANEIAVTKKAKEIFELVTGRDWAQANADEQRLARWAANADIRAENAALESWVFADADQCFR